MYFRVNLKIKKPTLCCCFTWIVFIEHNFTVAFFLIGKTWEDRFAGKVWRWGILRNGGGRGDPSSQEDDFKMVGMLIPLYGLWFWHIYFFPELSLNTPTPVFWIIF